MWFSKFAIRLLLVWFTVMPAWAASCTSINAACIQSVFVAGSGTVNITIATPGIGNNLYILGAGSSAAQSVSSVTGGGVTWSGAAVIRSNTNRDAEIWCGSSSSGSGTSVAVNASAGAFYVTVVEIAGNASTCVADKTGSSTTVSAGATFSGGTVTGTTRAGDVILTVLRYNSGTSVLVVPFSGLQHGAGSTQDAAIYFPGATGTFTPTWTGITGAVAESVTAAFLPPITSKCTMALLGVGC